MSEEIPKKGLGGVVVNEGPNFDVEVRYDLDVPEPRKHFNTRTMEIAAYSLVKQRTTSSSSASIALESVCPMCITC